MMAIAVERQPPAIALEPRLHGRLATLSAGRALVVEYFTSKSCCAVIGDFTVSWRTATPGPGYMSLPPIEGVPIYADRRLLAVLSEGMPELWPGGLFRRDTPTIRLGIPERWIQFLGGPPAQIRGARAERGPTGARRP